MIGSKTMQTRCDHMASTVKEDAMKLIETLPDQITWDDIMYESYIRQKIEPGLRDGNEGKWYPRKRWNG